MGEINDYKVPVEEVEDVPEELMDSLSEWALKEGYSHHPGELAKLFAERK